MCHTSICEGAHVEHFWKTLVCRPLRPSTLPKNTKTYGCFNLLCFFSSNDRFDFCERVALKNDPASSLPSKPVACNELSRVPSSRACTKTVPSTQNTQGTQNIQSTQTSTLYQVPREYLVPATKTVPCSRYQYLMKKLENQTELSGSSWKSLSAVTTLLGALPS